MTLMNIEGAFDSSVADARPLDETERAEATHNARRQQETRKDYFTIENGERFAGKHLLIDLKGARHLDDIDFIEKTLKACIDAAGATLLHIHLHHFTPYGGVSGVAVLAESHISIHSWPEENFAALDVFMCGNTQPEKAIDILKSAFAPDEINVETIKRGRIHGDV